MEVAKTFRKQFKSLRSSARLASSIKDNEFVEKIKETFLPKKQDLPYKFLQLKEVFEDKVLNKGKEVEELCSKIQVVTGKLSEAQEEDMKKDILFENLCLSNYEKLLKLMNDLISYFVNEFELRKYFYISHADAFLKEEINRLIEEHKEAFTPSTLIGGCSTICEIMLNYKFDEFQGEEKFRMGQ